MIIYEVNLAVDPSIAGEYLVWLRQHVQEMLEIRGFSNARIFEPDASSSEQGFLHFVCWYELEDRQALESYFSQHAERMRNDGVQKFGDRFSATRRILTPLKS